MSLPPKAFAVMPIQAFQDKRLTLWHLRVLGALFSFRNPKRTDAVFPSREAISERCGGLHIANVSRATSELERFGWLTKTGKGGFSKANNYMLTIPETLAESTTVDKPTTLAESTTVCAQTTVAESTTFTLVESTRGKEVTQEVTKKTSTKKSTPRKKPTTTLREFMDACKASGVEAIPAEGQVFEYAKTVGIDREMLDVAWIDFKAYWLSAEKVRKTKSDWPATFMSFLKNTGFGLWSVKPGELARWTSKGEQARRAAA